MSEFLLLQRVLDEILQTSQASLEEIKFQRRTTLFILAILLGVQGGDVVLQALVAEQVLTPPIVKGAGLLPGPP